MESEAGVPFEDIRTLLYFNDDLLIKVQSTVFGSSIINILHKDYS